jgi:hypothetical protein
MLGMNTTKIETALPSGRHRVSSRNEVRDALDDAVEKYRHLENLANALFAAKRHKLKAPIPGAGDFKEPARCEGAGATVIDTHEHTADFEGW